MHNVETPWTPLPVAAVQELMRGAGFFWCLAGGHAIERVTGVAYRPHDDIDIVVLRSQVLAVREWLSEWTLAAADPAGCLRPWLPGERLPWRVHDVWGHRPDAAGWELQVMIQEDENGRWYFRRDDHVHGAIADLATEVGGMPCLRMDLQLLYKAKSARPKDDEDFGHLVPVLTATQRDTLASWLRLTSPNGHPWLAALQRADVTR